MSKCLNCNKETETGNLQSCLRCGKVMCSDCSDRNFNLCPLCNSDMKHLQ